jgi:hypothetical protein
MMFVTLAARYAYRSECVHELAPIATHFVARKLPLHLLQGLLGLIRNASTR